MFEDYQDVLIPVGVVNHSQSGAQGFDAQQTIPRDALVPGNRDTGKISKSYGGALIVLLVAVS